MEDEKGEGIVVPYRKSPIQTNGNLDSHTDPDYEFGEDEGPPASVLENVNLKKFILSRVLPPLQPPPPIHNDFEQYQMNLRQSAMDLYNSHNNQALENRYRKKAQKMPRNGRGGVKNNSTWPQQKNVAPNFNRKVIQCSACKTYFENWNMFLHMRELHDRHICLFCLGLFDSVERLSHHLSKNHNITETVFTSVDDFHRIFKGSCFLVCCSCEKVFSENENFYNHYCCASRQQQQQKSASNCNVCKQVDSHSRGCSIVPDFEGLEGLDQGLVEVMRSKSRICVRDKKVEVREEVEKKEGEVLGGGDESFEARKEPEVNHVADEMMEVEESQGGGEEEGTLEVSKEEDEKKNGVGGDDTSRTAEAIDDSTKEEDEEEEAENANSWPIPPIEEQPSLSPASHPQAPSSPAPSTTHSSMFSPPYTENSPLEDNISPQKTPPDPGPPESTKTTASSTAPRSLVIKIKANNNSFTITNLKKSDSEENNNGEKSTSDDRIINHFAEEIYTDSDEEKPKVDHSVEEELEQEPSDGIALAGEGVQVFDLNVENVLESSDPVELLKSCIGLTSPVCVYCNHARKIAVNGKHLALHMLAEHKFQPQHPAIIIEMSRFVERLKKSLDELEEVFFNMDSFDSRTGMTVVPAAHELYECFHCRFSSPGYKDLYVHNRKMHQKTIILCVMCKMTFISYSELYCHLCPGLYDTEKTLRYRCCFCSVSDLPSGFRSMVHLRKLHNACDVCLERTGNQQQLSNHVWKHKLNHMCYRCCIAYRNKPDMKNHLFWKHGTESVPCKKCGEKKWPHVYHFCVPPMAFPCEECGLSFSKAVALRVHKRLHTNQLIHQCTKCEEKFISSKLLKKHEDSHQEFQGNEEEEKIDVVTNPMLDKSLGEENKEGQNEESNKMENSSGEANKETKQVKKVVDVLDLPPLNLSSDSESETEPEKVEVKTPEDENPGEAKPETSAANDNIMEVEQNEEEKQQEAQIMDGIWDNFKSYKASLGSESASMTKEDMEWMRKVILDDHDYCVIYDTRRLFNKENSEVMIEDVNGEPNDLAQPQPNMSAAATAAAAAAASPAKEDPSKKKSAKTSKKRKQSSSSSNSSSDTDSCPCGSNCSCSSSSSNSSSSSSSSSGSDSDSSTWPPAKKSCVTKKDKKNAKQAAAAADERQSSLSPTIINVVDFPPRESDLETDETLSDENFYDDDPKLLGSKLLEEKRNQALLAGIVNNGIGQSSGGAIGAEGSGGKLKKRLKSKKRKKEKDRARKAGPVSTGALKMVLPKAHVFEKKQNKNLGQYSNFNVPDFPVPNYQLSPAPLATPSPQTPKIQPMKLVSQNLLNSSSTSSTNNQRSSKRKRVPKKFYGDSSDEENNKSQQQQPPRWRKVQVPNFVVKQPEFAPSLKLTPSLPTLLPSSSYLMSAREEFGHQSTSLAPESNATDSDEPARSSSETESEDETKKLNVENRPRQYHPPQQQPPLPGQSGERKTQLYCYCRCPYDEVSEMIACDASHCKIEWFHFECVGIVSPPKGKWYCPDCRRRLGMAENFM